MINLLSGNARWRAVGHTNPPDLFKLDEVGSVVLSYDSTAKDRSLRAWDIQTGECLASFTPDSKINSCQLTSDGKTVLLAMEGREEGVLTLSLCRSSDRYPIEKGESTKPYGNQDFEGRIFDCSDS